MHRVCTDHAQPMHGFRAAAKADASPVLTFVLASGLTALAAPALGQTETFTLPAGCEAFVTVQGASCQVDHHFVCSGDPDGHKRRVSFDERSMTYLGTTDDETQWIGSFHPISGHTEVLEPSPADPASLTELIETGRDSYDFRTFSDEVGTTRYVGADELTGRLVEIDDVTLQETSYQITAYAEDGTELWSAKGNEFISANWRSFLAGTGTVTVPGDTYDKDNRPVEFIFPGEPGFLSINPKHGCGVVMSSYEVAR